MQYQHRRSLSWTDRKLLSLHSEAELSQVLKSSQREVIIIIQVINHLKNHNIPFVKPLLLFVQLPIGIRRISWRLPRFDDRYLNMLHRWWGCETKQHPRRNCRITPGQKQTQQIHFVALCFKFVSFPHSQVLHLQSRNKMSHVYPYLPFIYHFPSFYLISNVDIGIKIQIIDDERLFCTSVAASKPKLVVTSATLHILACLLEPQCLLQIHQKLNGTNGSIQFQFLRTTVKTFSVESVSQYTNPYMCFVFLSCQYNEWTY